MSDPVPRQTTTAATPPDYCAPTAYPTSFGTVSRSRMRGVWEMATALQRATTVSQVQSAYLGAIRTTVTAGGHGFYVLDPSDLRMIDVAATVPDGFLERYEREGRADDPVLQAAVATREPADSSTLLSERPWDSSAVHSVLELAGFHHSLEAPVIVDGEVVGTLNMARERDDPPFSAEDRALMALVASQVGAALTRTQRAEDLARKTSLLADALDAANEPILITTVEGEVIFTNRMTARPVPGSSASYFDRAQAALSAALDELRKGDRRIVSILEEVSGDGHGPGRPMNGQVAVKAVRLRSRHDAVVAFLSHRWRAVAGLPEGAGVPLSRREREIADLVSRGLTNRQIAELSFVSENTVKQHLKRIFAKLDVGSRAELVQAVWQAAAPANEEPTPG